MNCHEIFFIFILNKFTFFCLLSQFDYFFSVRLLPLLWSDLVLWAFKWLITLYDFLLECFFLSDQTLECWGRRDISHVATFLPSDRQELRSIQLI